MALRSLWFLVIAACLCMAPVCSLAADNTEAMLQKADSLRSSNPGEFALLLASLNVAHDGVTQNQRDRITYLNGYSKAYAGDFSGAIHDMQGLVESSTDEDIKFRARALIVNQYAVTRQFTDGLRQLEYILPFVDHTTNNDLRDHGLAVTSQLYNQVGQYKLGLHYADKMLAVANAARSRCFAGQYRLEALQNLNALPEDDAPIRTVIEQCESAKEAVVTNLARTHLARKWADHGERAAAIALLKSHLKEVKATRYPPLIGQFEALLADYLLADGNLDGAQAHADAAIEQRAGMTFSIHLASAYKTLYEIAERRNEPVAALSHYTRYAETNMAYLGEVKTRELAYQIVRQETLQKSQQIELLDRKNQVLQLQQRVDRQSAQYSRLMIVLLVFLMGSIVFWAFKIKRVQLSLRRMAQTDALTGIFNRHYFTQQSEHTLAQCARAGEDVALIMFDLDHFKSINDRFGHDVGDWALKRVTDACKTFCRRIDHLGRIGGEEFAILLSGCDLRGATRVAEDCRVRIASIDTSPSGRNKFLITASFGVTASSLSGYDLVKLLSQADQMLYRAKRDGRNRVATFDGQVPNWSPLQSVPGSEQATGQGPVAVESGAT